MYGKIRGTVRELSFESQLWFSDFLSTHIKEPMVFCLTLDLHPPSWMKQASAAFFFV